MEGEPGIFNLLTDSGPTRQLRDTVKILYCSIHKVLSCNLRKKKMSGKTASKALRAAISNGILGSPSLVYEPGRPKHAALFYDLDEFEVGLDRAKEAFGEGSCFSPATVLKLQL